MVSSPGSIGLTQNTAIGNIIGPQFFLRSQAPHYPLGIGAMICAFAIMAASGALHYAYCVYENGRRDRVYGKPVVDREVLAELDSADVTDRENRDFRYTY